MIHSIIRTKNETDYEIRRMNKKNNNKLNCKRLRKNG